VLDSEEPYLVFTPKTLVRSRLCDGAPARRRLRGRSYGWSRLEITDGTPTEFVSTVREFRSRTSRRHRRRTEHDTSSSRITVRLVEGEVHNSGARGFERVVRHPESFEPGLETGVRRSTAVV